MRDKRQEAGRAPSWGNPIVYPRPKGKQTPSYRKPVCGPEDRRIVMSVLLSSGPHTGWDSACEWVPPPPCCSILTLAQLGRPRQGHAPSTRRLLREVSRRGRQAASTQEV